jgi:hypothetical protein
MAPAHHAAQIEHGVGGYPAIGQGRGLDEQEPVPVGAGEGLGRAFVHGERRRDVEQHHPPYPLGRVERQPVSDPGTAVVRADDEALVTERGHQGDRVGPPSPACCAPHAWHPLLDGQSRRSRAGPSQRR